MQVSREQFMEQGYLVLREVIPRERLEQMRADFETLVGRQRKIWARERGPDDPPGGVWETNPQPRLVSYNGLIDKATASTVEVWLQESTLGVSRQLSERSGGGVGGRHDVDVQPGARSWPGRVASRYPSDRHGAAGRTAEGFEEERAQVRAVEHPAV